MLRFETIDLEKHRNNVIRFRKDSFKVSFGDSSGFGDEEVYLKWLRKKVAEFPKGFVMVKENEELIGQLELSIRTYQGKNVGHVHLYYLAPEKRSKGLGQELHQYAMRFFKSQKVTEYYLRVAPNNLQALNFYRKNEMKEIGHEMNGKVIRMWGMVL